MEDKEFRELFVPRGSLRLAAARFAARKGCLSEDERKGCSDIIVRLRAWLIEKEFQSRSEFLAFWSQFRGYVEAAFSWEGGTDFFKDLILSPRNPLGVRMCLVNLYNRVMRRASATVSSGNMCQAPDDEEKFLAVTHGCNAKEVVIHLVRRKIRAGVICRMVDVIEARQPGCVASFIEEYVANGLFVREAQIGRNIQQT